MEAGHGSVQLHGSKQICPALTHSSRFEHVIVSSSVARARADLARSSNSSSSTGWAGRRRMSVHSVHMGPRTDDCDGHKSQHLMKNACALICFMAC